MYLVHTASCTQQAGSQILGWTAISSTSTITVRQDGRRAPLQPKPLITSHMPHLNGQVKRGTTALSSGGTYSWGETLYVSFSDDGDDDGG